MMDESLSLNGYAVIRQAIAPADVASLRERLRPLMRGHDRNGEIEWPSRVEKDLRHHPAYLAAREVAGRLLHTRWPRLVFEHAIHREPGDPQVTDWHQDAAYFERHISQRQVHLWIPLHDVDERRGPLRYVPTRHSRRVLAHHTANGTDRLVLDAVDEAAAVVCPAAIGDVVAHVPSTPHAAMPNVSEAPRQVYILQFRRTI